MLDEQFIDKKKEFARMRILNLYNYLQIQEVYPSNSKCYTELNNRFHSINFNIVTFPFSEDGAIKDEEESEAYRKAQSKLVKLISKIHLPQYIYITMGLYGIGFWIKIESDAFQKYLMKFISEYRNIFFVLINEDSGCRLYRSEYAWELLYFMANSEPTEIHL